MSNSVAKPIPVESARNWWYFFDAALLVFVVLHLIVAMLAGLFAAYRVGSHPLLLEGVLAFRLFPLTCVLFITALVCVVVRAFRRRVTVFSIITLICLGTHVFLLWIPVRFGTRLGRDLLARNGVNTRVAQECLLIAESELCKTDVWIMAYSGTWKPQEGLNDLASVALELQAKCPAICSLRPRDISCRPDSVSIELHGGFDHFGYTFTPKGTNWVLEWYTERNEPEELVSIARRGQIFVITD